MSKLRSKRLSSFGALSFCPHSPNLVEGVFSERRTFGVLRRSANRQKKSKSSSFGLLTSNVNPKIVSEMLGHATIAITLDTYSHVLPNMQHSAVAAMEEAFS